MNIKCIICVICFLFSVLETSAQVSMNKISEKVVLSVDLVGSKKKELRYSFALQNNGTKAVFYSANPQQVDGVVTPYISIDENDSSLLNIQWRIFHRDIVMNIENDGGNKTRVELKRLEPGETVRQELLIKWPLKETVPPLMDYGRQKAIERGNVKRIRFTVGYFEEEEGVVEFLTRKRFGWFIKGYESLETGGFRGKRFDEIQKLVSTEVLIPELKNR